MQSEKQLQNRVAIITGGDRGVGRGIAIEMAKAGANIVIACRDKEMAKKAKQEIKQYHTEVTIIPTDITKPTDRKNLLNQTMQQFGQIDILVNNAAIASSKEFLKTNTQEIETIIQTNLTAPMLLTHELVINWQKENRGERQHNETQPKIVLFTSSTHSHITGLMPAYSTTKAGIEMFMKEAALELADKNIRINAVAPGIVATHGETDTKNQEVPIGYACIPEDIGKAMVFLASDAARFITGQTLIVDGGFSLTHLHYWKKKRIPV